MRQILKPGQPVDFATTSEIGEIVAESFARERSEMYRREKGAFALDTTGAGSQSIRGNRLYDQIFERVTVSAGPGALVQMFSNQASPADLLEIISVGAQGVYSDSFSNCLFLEAGSSLLIVVSGGTVGGQCMFNFQTRLIRSSGSGSMT